VGIIAAKKYEDGKKVEMSIGEKTTVMTKFRNNETNILLATNIIARGIDVRNACFVINVGPPKTSEKESDIDLDIYLHRVGRTGRHNDKGLALTLIQKESVDRLVGGIKKIHKIEVHEMKEPEQLVNEVKDCIKVNSE
jgi:superfamily II DNA/RNA helicase